MSEEVIKYGSGGVPYKGGPVKKQVEEVEKEPEVIVTLVDAVETDAQELSELGIEK